MRKNGRVIDVGLIKTLRTAEQIVFKTLYAQKNSKKFEKEYILNIGDSSQNRVLDLMVKIDSAEEFLYSYTMVFTDIDGRVIENYCCLTIIDSEQIKSNFYKCRALAFVWPE